MVGKRQGQVYIRLFNQALGRRVQSRIEVERVEASIIGEDPEEAVRRYRERLRGYDPKADHTREEGREVLGRVLSARVWSGPRTGILYRAWVVRQGIEEDDQCQGNGCDDKGEVDDGLGLGVSLVSLGPTFESQKEVAEPSNHADAMFATGLRRPIAQTGDAPHDHPTAAIAKPHTRYSTSGAEPGDVKGAALGSPCF